MSRGVSGAAATPRSQGESNDVRALRPDSHKCWQKAFAIGAPDAHPACLTAAETRFSEAITRAEAKGGCASVGDEAIIESAVDACVDDLVGLTPAEQDACYSGQTAEVGPVFTSGMLVGLAAGDDQCDIHFAGSHMCTYEDLLTVQLAGQLAAVDDTTTFWLQRDTTADVSSIPSPPGPGGNS